MAGLICDDSLSWSQVYFRENCLTDLTPLLSQGGPADMPRFQALAENFSADKCIFYKQGDSRVSAGLARIFEAQIQMALTFAAADSSTIVSTQEDYQFLVHYTNDSEEFL
jgi:hypothetical protein